MADRATLSLVDASGEATRMQWYTPNVSGVNYAAVLASTDAIRVAAEAITLCNERSLDASLTWHFANGTPPADPYAQRELAIKVFYVDNVNAKKGHTSIPGPDLTQITLVGDAVTLDDGAEMAAFVTAFEAGAVSQDGNAVTVTHARLVGRRS